MGLDMYLMASKYVNKMNYKTDPPSSLPEYEKVAALFPEMDNDMIYGFDVTRVVGYWRKANQIHQWFVDNVQEGEDDCRKYDVSRDQLVELRDICQSVLDNKDKAEEELPTQAGFFFGSTDYDEDYWSDLEQTITTINNILNNKGLEDCYLYYQSSW